MIKHILITVLFLTACGTTDYASPPPTTQVQQEEAPTKDQAQKGTPHPFVSPPVPGHIWGGMTWIGVPDAMVENLKCGLADDSTVGAYSPFGTSLLGGAVLGMIIRSSGSWFFGKPPQPGPGHWFWSRLDETVKTVGQGAFRGAIFGGVCETLLAGGNFTAFAGLLGENFGALSSAITIGGMATLAAAPYVADRLGNIPPQENVPPSYIWHDRKSWRDIAATLNDWSNTTEIGQGMRYRLGPGLIILGIGGGVGVIVYKRLQKDAQAQDRQDCPQSQ